MGAASARSSESKTILRRSSDTRQSISDVTAHGSMLTVRWGEAETHASGRRSMLYQASAENAVAAVRGVDERLAKTRNEMAGASTCRRQSQELVRLEKGQRHEERRR